MARLDLGLTDAEFRHLTPREFDALTQRHVLAQRREDFRAGLVAASIYNAMSGGKKGRRPFQPWDFFPATKPPPAVKSAAQLEAEVVAFVKRGQRSKRNGS